MAKTPDLKTVATLKHDDAKRRNIPTAEYQSMLENEQKTPKEVRYPRNTDLDPQPALLRCLHNHLIFINLNFLLGTILDETPL